MRKENKEGCDRRLHIGRARWVNKIRRNSFWFTKVLLIFVLGKHNPVFDKCTFFCKHGDKDFNRQNFLRIGDRWFKSKFQTFPRSKTLHPPRPPPPACLDKQSAFCASWDRDPVVSTLSRTSHRCPWGGGRGGHGCVPGVSKCES